MSTSFSESINQFIYGTGLLEWFGVFTGILCVWLAAKNNIWNWPIALICVSIYIFIFYESKLYADMGLQFYLFAVNAYGWYFWSRKKGRQQSEQPITLITKKEIGYAVIAIGVFTVMLGLFLHKNTDASFPFIDSFCTACSLVAQFFLARRVLQNWLIWIFVNIVYVGLYFAKDLKATALMYGLYIVIATIGYLDWKKIYREQTH